MHRLYVNNTIFSYFYKLVAPMYCKSYRNWYNNWENGIAFYGKVVIMKCRLFDQRKEALL